MTSFIAAGGSGRSTSVIPAVPAASSVTTIAFIRDLPASSYSRGSHYCVRLAEPQPPAAGARRAGSKSSITLGRSALQALPPARRRPMWLLLVGALLSGVLFVVITEALDGSSDRRAALTVAVLGRGGSTQAGKDVTRHGAVR